MCSHAFASESEGGGALIENNPSGAVIEVHDQYIGQTQLRVDFGRHPIAVPDISLLQPIRLKKEHLSQKFSRRVMAQYPTTPDHIFFDLRFERAADVKVNSM